MIQAHTYVPGPPLNRFIGLFWLFQRETGHVREQALPTGTMELVIDLDDDHLSVGNRDEAMRTMRGPMVCGVYSEYFVIDSSRPSPILGVHFKPGGAFPFLGVPADELRNIHVSLDDIWGPLAHELRERLHGLAPQQLFATLEHYLMAFVRSGRRRYGGTLEQHPAVAHAIARLGAPDSPSVASVAGDTGFSMRRFIELFRQEVGLTPKVFARVMRFQRVLERVHAQEDIDWTDAALSCGYFDQAHFIHDFRSFSGLNPTTYRARRSEHRNHVPLP